MWRCCLLLRLCEDMFTEWKPNTGTICSPFWAFFFTATQPLWGFTTIIRKQQACKDQVAYNNHRALRSNPYTCAKAQDLLLHWRECNTVLLHLLIGDIEMGYGWVCWMWGCLSCLPPIVPWRHLSQGCVPLCTTFTASHRLFSMSPKTSQGREQSRI